MNILVNKRNLPYLSLNAIIIVIFAIVMVVNKANAKPAHSISSPSINTGLLSYQGTLLNSDGYPLTGSYDITFRIYDSPKSSFVLWEEDRIGSNAVLVKDGLFDVILGSLNPIPESVWESSELFLGVQIDSDAEMLPREMITGIPFANKAGIAASVTTNSITGDNIIDGSLNQADAPTLLQSANGQNEIIRSGNSVFTDGSDSDGAIVINYPCFPTDVRVFLALNGHWDANHSIVVANQVPGNCETTIIVSPPTTAPIRINWIAIGN